MRNALPILIVLALASCAQPVRTPPPSAQAPVTDTTPLRFTVQASRNDAWNAIGQILVRTPGVRYDGRAQMLGLNAVRYRGEALMLLARALPLSHTIKTLTTEVSVTTTHGKPMHSDNAAELLALLARQLPAEIESVKAGLAAQQKTKQKTGTGKKERKM
ncbi:hypothetical protein MQC88_12590 [Luteimonas sp. 50]|uniref:Uncharacterized protein n=1 Tax=Cognatiluteimonas sedimenti TaxID=2927791 RepID=A0ABT0A711_9GAMM|nr:hypothetical protein [Lysobacter sedimenti]MCJ0826780.1 hypothetical protein [Lysobacter sedimenti]